MGHPSVLSKLRTLHISALDATFEVSNKATIFGSIIEVWIPASPYPKLKDGMEAQTPNLSGTPRGSSTFAEQNAKRSLRRSRQELSGILKSNQFTHWGTFTMRDNRQDGEASRKKMINWLHLQQKRKGKFEYVLVPEHHKTGELHFHVLMVAYTGKITPAINSKITSKFYGQPLRIKGRQVHTVDSYTLGHSNMVLIGDSDEDRAKVGNYLGKYITKEWASTEHHEADKKRYWASRGLIRPKTIYNLEHHTWGKPTATYANEYGIKLTYPRDPFLDKQLKLI